MSETITSTASNEVAGRWLRPSSGRTAGGSTRRANWSRSVVFLALAFFAGCQIPREGFPADSDGPRVKSRRSSAMEASAPVPVAETAAQMETPASSPTPGGDAPAAGATGFSQTNALIIREGDVLKISFPGTPNLDSTQQVRLDGRITLALVGEVQAAGMTPKALEKDLLQRFSNQLVSKEVTVQVVSSSFAIYVSGAVLRPGKFMSDRPLTALEAIMEAGGFDPVKANSKAVVVIRQEGGQTRNYSLNLKVFLDGKPGVTFYLKNADIVFVPEKFSWF